MIDDRAVFIGGIAGTGKTKLGACLGRHSRLAVTRKTYLWRAVYGRYGELTDTANLERCLGAVLSSPGVDALGLDEVRLRAELPEPPTYAALFAAVHRLHALDVGKSRWCDQLGLIEAYAEPIFAAFPAAKMIHMVRDPRCRRLADQPPGKVGWMVGKWLTSLELAERNAAHFGNRYLVVRHEDFERDEEGTLHAVCAFLDESFEPAMLPPGPETEPATDPAPTRSRRFIATTAHDLMARPGYTVDSPRRPTRLGHGLVEWPANRVALAAWRQVKIRSIARQLADRP